ncbi:hypothetical protein QBC37DRAFT_466339 [Rhypophila decipiens]|uniref:Uncharacterized protein n=1 Tax=Rhypophila decipiens TaxID=261697 RepID=A0AAN6YHU5_9PEZI|nr:hypothetical protein QBC37DRAFT_466339 [Rhypophila decipiens]
MYGYGYGYPVLPRTPPVFCSDSKISPYPYRAVYGSVQGIEARGIITLTPYCGSLLTSGLRRLMMMYPWIKPRKKGYSNRTDSQSYSISVKAFARFTQSGNIVFGNRTDTVAQARERVVGWSQRMPSGLTVSWPPRSEIGLYGWTTKESNEHANPSQDSRHGRDEISLNKDRGCQPDVRFRFHFFPWQVGCLAKKFAAIRMLTSVQRPSHDDKRQAPHLAGTLLNVSLLCLGVGLAMWLAKRYRYIGPALA